LRELEEKIFVQEGYRKNPGLFWFWSVLVLLAIFIIARVNLITTTIQQEQLQTSPFLQVTNRDFSLFLWQYPHFMRVHAKNKIGYLTGFQYLHKVNLELEYSEDYVVVPPQVLFSYHTWKRLLSSYIISRPISQIEFKEFLNLVPEWQPFNWVQSPENYKNLVEAIETSNFGNLDQLSYEVLPSAIRQAFYGWKNFYKEGDLINVFNPTQNEMEIFLKKFPNYNRNFWQNIEVDYLKSFTSTNYKSKEAIPQTQIPAFLKVAIYNYVQARNGL
jgi:cellobiose-specific phosphotransferase system component IIB